MRSILVVLMLSGCAPAWKAVPHDVPFQRTPITVLHAQPEVAHGSDWWNIALRSTVAPLGKLASPARLVDRLTGGRRALDINAFGQVPDSQWFTNRMGKAPLSPSAVKRGANTEPGPADGPLLVLNGKTEGVTPGVVARDTAGVIWFIKFDPPSHPELSSGAETVAARLLHAAGYHVPQTYVVDLHLSRLSLSEDATAKDEYNEWQPFKPKALKNLLGTLNPDPKGRTRALFSRAVPGAPLGPFSYTGVDPRDPNSRVPNERRRSLRGLWVFMAWLNNTDTRARNTLDTFIQSPARSGKGFVRHYLIDFGDSLGSSGNRVKYVGEGYEYRVDWARLGQRMITLGMAYPYWLAVRRSPYRSVGVFESEVFHPSTWSPMIPNPAFDEATALDTYWGAAILARFTDAHIRAAVDAAAYSDAGAADLIFQVLKRRRAKLLRYAFSRVLALDDARVKDRCRVQLTDLAPPSGRAHYQWRLDWTRTGRSRVLLGRGMGPTPHVDLCALLGGARDPRRRLRGRPVCDADVASPARRQQRPARKSALEIARRRPIARWYQPQY